MKYLQDSFSIPMSGRAASENWKNTFGKYIQFRQKKLRAVDEALVSLPPNEENLETKIQDATGLDLWEVEELLAELSDVNS